MAEIHLHVTMAQLDELMVDEVIALEEPGDVPLRQLRDVLARFVVAEDGQPVSLAEAKAMLGHVKARSEFIEIARQVFALVRGVAANPTK